MGLMDTIKGWFNIGGVTVKLKDVNPLISKSKNTITGQAILTTGSDKTVLKMEYKFVLKKTTGSGEDKKTDEFVIGYTEAAEPFEIKKGETKTIDFTINYALEKTLADMGGVLGTVGKVANWLSTDKLEYFVICLCDVKGAAFDPNAELKVTIVD
jgi:hypothetical protein